MAPHDQEVNSFLVEQIPASAAPHTLTPRLEEFRDDHRKVRRTEKGRCCGDYYYSENELETVDALILLSLSRGGLCISSSSSNSTSDINSGDSKSNVTEAPSVTQISRDENNSLVLRIRVASKPAKQIGYKCDKCEKEFSSPQALGGHKTSHRRKPTIPDLNAPLRVFECSICGDVYDSVWALGGHKRKHRSI